MSNKENASSTKPAHATETPIRKRACLNTIQHIRLLSYLTNGATQRYKMYLLYTVSCQKNALLFIFSSSYYT